MSFAAQTWIIAGLLALPALAALYYQAEKSKTRKLAHFASAKLLLDLAASFSPVKRNIKAILSVMGIFFILAALARPQWGYVWQVQKGRGIDILIALDTSKSMLAEDIRPNRLERAKLAILDLAERAEGDRLGLIAFSGNAFLQCPLTLDYDAFRQTVETVDTAIISRGGTNIAAAIAEARVSFAEKDNFKILVLLTDGEDLKAAGIEEARKAAEDGVKIYTVGVGSLAGELIPIRGEDGGVDFLRDERGNIVKTRLDENTLTTIAEVTGGFYRHLGSTGQGLEQVYSEGLQSIPKEERETRLQQVPHERFQWPLGLALLFLMAETCLGTRKRNIRYSPIPLRWTLLLALAALPVLFTSPGASASPRKAEKFYREGKFDEAGQEYLKAAEDSPGDPRLYYNIGAAQYRLGHFEEAGEALGRAIETEDPLLQKDAYYNLGNTRFRLGESTLEIDPAQTIEIWEEGLKDYENTLNIAPGDEDAKFNHELLKKRIEDLKKQQQQQNQENQDQQDQESSSDNQNQDQNQDQQDSQEQEGQEQSQNQEQGEQEEQGQQQPSGGDEKKEDGEEQARTLPGRMSREEARQLLEAMRNDEKKLPVIQLEIADPKDEKDAQFRDW